MKAILLAAAITLGAAGAAVAQDSTPAMNQPSNGQTPADTMGASTPNTAGTSSTMPADSSAAPADSSATPMASPAPADASSMPADTSAAPAPAAASDYPPCSRTVTDKCVEGGSHKKMMRKRR